MSLDVRYTVSVNPLRMLVTLIRAHGLRAAPLLVRHGIDPAALDDIEARVPMRVACELWDDAAHVLHDPDVGFSAGCHASLGDGLVAYAVQASDTLGAAFQLVTRFHRLISDAVEPHIVEAGDRARISLQTKLRDPELPLHHLTDLYLAKLVAGGRLLTGVRWHPRAVRFRHRRPCHLDVQRRFFGAPLTFCHVVDELELDRSVLRLRVRGAEPRLLHILDRYASHVLSRLPPANDFVKAVQFVIATSLCQQEPTLERLAAHFHMSVRTLQRRLADGGVSLRELVDDARHELALRYLERDDLTLGEIAFLLGFGSRQSFHRACCRWTGTTPAEARRRLRENTRSAQA